MTGAAGAKQRRLADGPDLSTSSQDLARNAEIATDALAALRRCAGEMRIELQRLALSRGVGDRVRFTGALSHEELVEYYNAARRAGKKPARKPMTPRTPMTMTAT